MLYPHLLDNHCKEELELFMIHAPQSSFLRSKTLSLLREREREEDKISLETVILVNLFKTEKEQMIICAQSPPGIEKWCFQSMDCSHKGRC